MEYKRDIFIDRSKRKINSRENCKKKTIMISTKIHMNLIDECYKNGLLIKGLFRASYL
jgi:hypothetical protein